MLAAGTGFEVLARYLLTIPGTNPHHESSDGMNAATLASIAGLEDLAAAIRSAPQQAVKDIDPVAPMGRDQVFIFLYSLCSGCAIVRVWV